MEINALLCDHAQVSGKLFISGANINQFRFIAGSPGPYPVTFAVGGVVEVPGDATGTDHHLTFAVLTQDGQTPELGAGVETPAQGIGGEVIFNVARPAGPGLEEQLVPFTYSFVQLPLAKIGYYNVTLSLDGTEVRRLHFSVTLEPPAAA